MEISGTQAVIRLASDQPRWRVAQSATAVVLGLTMSAILAGCTPDGSPTGAEEQICRQANVAWGNTSVDDIADDIALIRQLNVARGESDGLYWQVWQLADAWDGHIATRDYPELADGGAGVVASLENLLEACGYLGY